MAKPARMFMATVLIFFTGGTACQKKDTMMGNPASAKCESAGGVVIGSAEKGGTFGLCVFPGAGAPDRCVAEIPLDGKTFCIGSGGSVCEEWAYFRGECREGACPVTCDRGGDKGEGLYDCRGRLLAQVQCAE